MLRPRTDWDDHSLPKGEGRGEGKELFRGVEIIF